jgi:predicted DNA-binding ribbon-helix-helix protein
VLDSKRREELLPVRALRGESKANIYYAQYTRGQTDLRTFQSIRIAAAVPALMVLQHRIGGVRTNLRIERHYLRTIDGMPLDSAHFCIVKIARLVEDTLRKQNIADILKQRCHAYLFQLASTHAGRFAYQHGERCNFHRVNIVVIA